MKTKVKSISVCASLLLDISVFRSLLCRLWDPDYTNLTFSERKRLERPEEKMAVGMQDFQGKRKTAQNGLAKSFPRFCQWMQGYTSPKEK